MTVDGTDGASAIRPASMAVPIQAAPSPSAARVPAEVSEFAAATLPGWPMAWGTLVAAVAGVALAATAAAFMIPASAVTGVLLILVATGSRSGADHGGCLAKPGWSSCSAGTPARSGNRACSGRVRLPRRGRWAPRQARPTARPRPPAQGRGPVR